MCCFCLADTSTVTVLPPPLLRYQVEIGKLPLDPLGVGIRLIDLVDRHNDRHVRCPGVIDRLLRLRHDAVIGGNDQDDDVGDAGASGAHQGEGGVARGVEKHDVA